MQPVILVIGWIEKTGFVGVLVFLAGLYIMFVRRRNETKGIRQELEGCISMVSKCSRLLCLLKWNPYATGLDIDFLRSKLSWNYFRIYNTDDVVLSDKEGRVLEESLLWLRIADERISTEGCEARGSSEQKSVDYDLAIKGGRDASVCPYDAVLSIVLGGPMDIRQSNHPKDLEWFYYMWLTVLFMQSMCTDNSANRKELKDLCFRIEGWIEDSGMVDCLYLKDKIKECRDWLAAG